MLLAAPVLVVVLTLGLVAGLGLLIRGWRGRRIDDHPLCRRCGYDLIASAQAANCPECGRDLQRHGAIRIGHRRKRRLALTCGTLLLLATLGGGGLLGWSHFANFDWYPHKPLWLLRRDAAGTDPSKAIASQREIVQRLVAAKLSQPQIDSIVNEAITAQANAQMTWFGWWGDFIELGWQQGSVSEQAVIQYARTAVENSYSLIIPERVRQWSMLTVGMSHKTIRAGSSGLLMADVQYSDVTMEDGTRIGGGSGRSRSGIASGGSGSSASGSMMELPIGRHVASAVARVRIYRTVVAALADEMDADGAIVPPALTEFTMTLQKPFEVVPNDREIVERVADQSLEPAIRAATSIRITRVLLTSRGTEIRCDVEIQNPPMSVAFQVLVRVGEREWEIGHVAGEPGDFQHSFSSMRPRNRQTSATRLIRDFPADAGTVDVILRPSAKAGEDAGMVQIWDGEIAFNDVAVEQETTRVRD